MKDFSGAAQIYCPINVMIKESQKCQNEWKPEFSWLQRSTYVGEAFIKLHHVLWSLSKCSSFPVLPQIPSILPNEILAHSSLSCHLLSWEVNLQELAFLKNWNWQSAYAGWVGRWNFCWVSSSWYYIEVSVSLAMLLWLWISWTHHHWSNQVSNLEDILDSPLSSHCRNPIHTVV